MADKIRLLMEGMLPDMLYYLKRQVFTKNEIRDIMQQRENNEYLIMRKNASLKDILKSIDFEYDLERRRRKQYNDLKIKKENEKDFQIIKRIVQLWDKTTQRHKYDIELWKQYLSFCYFIKSKRLFFKAITTALRFNSNSSDLWQLAANYEYEVNRNPFKARKVYYKALKVNSKSEELWVEYFKFEINFMKMIQERNQILNGGEEKNQIIEEEKDGEDEDELQADFLGFEDKDANLDDLQQKQDYHSIEESKEILTTIYNLSTQFIDPIKISTSLIDVLKKQENLKLENLEQYIYNLILTKHLQNSNLQTKVEFLIQYHNLNDFEIEATQYEENFGNLINNQNVKQQEKIVILQYYINQKEQIEKLISQENKKFIDLMQNKIILEILTDNNNIQIVYEFLKELSIFSNEIIVKKLQQYFEQNQSSDFLCQQLISLSYIQDKEYSQKQIIQNLDLGMKFQKQERLNLLERVLELYIQLNKNQNQKACLKLLNTSIKNLLNFKPEFEKFLVKFLNFIKEDKDFTNQTINKLLQYNQNCPLKIFLIYIEQSDLDDLKQQKNVSQLFEKLTNWYPKEKQMWIAYFKVSKLINPSNLPLIFEKACKTSGIPYQDLQNEYNTLLQEIEEEG